MGSQTAGFQLEAHRSRSIAIGASIGVHLLIGICILTATFRPFKLSQEAADPPPMVAETLTLEPKTPPAAPTPAHRSIAPRQPATTSPFQTEDPLPVRAATTDTPDTIAPVTLSPTGSAGLTLGAPTLSAKTITNPEWIERPGAREFSRVYPEEALRENLGGAVTLDCEVTATGAVRRCAIVIETPAGRGFGRAALSLSGYFRLSPRTENGEAVDGAQVRIPVRFNAGA